VTKPSIPAWLARLKRRFSPGLLRLGNDGAHPLPGGGTAGTLALVGRELCLFLHVDASHVPVKQREGFVALEVRRAAPFADPESDVLWLNGHAAAWYWSRERIRGIAGGASRYRAEALFRGHVHRDDCVELLALGATPPGAADAGFDARVWRDGRIVASRWWPRVPDAVAWQAFVRGAGIDARHAALDPDPAPMRTQPLAGGTERLALAGQFGSQRGLIAAGAAMLMLALLAWQGASAARVAWRVHSVERQIAALGASMGKTIDARARADDARARIDTMLALRTPASQTRLLAEVKRVTPGTWQLASWSQPGPESLEVTLRAANADVAAIVAAWEASPLFQDVTPASGAGAGEIRLQAKLTPLPEQSP
jgi:hypothetical protein